MMITNEQLMWLAPVAAGGVMAVTSMVTGYLDAHRRRHANLAVEDGRVLADEVATFVERISAKMTVAGAVSAEETFQQAANAAQRAANIARLAAHEAALASIREAVTNNEQPRVTPEAPAARPRGR